MDLPEDLAAQLPPEVRDHPFVKDAPDMPTFFKNSVETKRMVGDSIRLPGKDSKPEEVETWRQTHMPKLAERGLIEAAPGKPEEYEFQPPDVEGYNFDENTVKGFQDVAHQLGLTKTQAQGLLAFDAQRFKGAKAAFETQNALVPHEEATKGYEERFKEKSLEALSNARKAITEVKTSVLPEIVEELEGATVTAKDGKRYAAGDWLPFIAMASRYGQSISPDHAGNFGKGSGVESADTIQSHIDEIEQSPKFKAGDPETVERRDNLFRKKYGTKEVA